MKITFHKFPENSEIRQTWMKNIGLTEAELPHRPYLCSVHFNDEAFDRTSVNSIRLQPNSTPMDCTAQTSIESRIAVETQIESDDLPHQSLHRAVVLEDSITIKNEPIFIPEQLFMGESSVDQSEIGNPAINELRVLHRIKPENISEKECEPLTKQRCITEITDDTLENHDVVVHLFQNVATEEVFKDEMVVDETCIPFYTQPTLYSTLGTRSTSVLPDHFQSPIKQEYADKATSVSPRLHFNSPRKCQLRALLKKQAQSHAQEIKLLKQKCQRREQKITSLEQALSALQRKNAVQDPNIS